MRWLVPRMLRVACMIALASCSADEPACSSSIDAFCANGTCPRTWQAAQDPVSWGAECTYGRVDLAACADGHVALDVRLDDGLTYYYDASGALYRVEYQGMIDDGKCLAGGGTAKVCGNTTFQTLCGNGP